MNNSLLQPLEILLSQTPLLIRQGRLPLGEKDPLSPAFGKSGSFQAAPAFYRSRRRRWIIRLYSQDM